MLVNHAQKDLAIMLLFLFLQSVIEAILLHALVLGRHILEVLIHLIDLEDWVDTHHVTAFKIQISHKFIFQFFFYLDFFFHSFASNSLAALSYSSTSRLWYLLFWSHYLNTFAG